MRLVRIREAQPLDNYRVQLTLTDGRVVERDLGPMLVGPVFAEIRNDQARFSEMRVEGGTLVWPATRVSLNRAWSFRISAKTRHDLARCVWKAAPWFGLPAPTC